MKKLLQNNGNSTLKNELNKTHEQDKGDERKGLTKMELVKDDEVIDATKQIK